jgi:RNA polymerase sigma factor (sigma-70 family)
VGDLTSRRTDADRRERFRAIYEANYHRILGYALRRCAGPDDAADVVAETFLVAWQRLDDLRRDDELLWLYGVARRVLANQRRGEGRRRQLGERLREELRRVAPSPFVWGRDGELDDVVAALAGLSDRDREVITLSAWEGLDGRELATVLGCSTNAAKIRLHRARRQLARRLGADVGSGAVKPVSAGGQIVGEAAERVIRRSTKEDPA